VEGPIIIGKSVAIKKLLSFIKKAARSDANVLVLGETGVGKELVAKAIHCMSNRIDKPFVRLNCGNLNENLVESELFGHHKGAFTGAINDRPGLIEIANSGTFFFDEIGDMDLSLQARILSVIEDREIRRLGENVIRKIDARFIFATNRDLISLVGKGKFRQDLFYRINILTVYIPPLRERREDITLLIESFLDRESSRKSIKATITEGAKRKIVDHSFPGNIRELENILKRACELSSGEMIEEHDIVFQQLLRRSSRHAKSKYKMSAIVDALVRCDGNKAKAAKELGISRVHLYRLLNR
jgi:Nif-specific regulatory protein